MERFVELASFRFLREKNVNIGIDYKTTSTTNAIMHKMEGKIEPA